MVPVEDFESAAETEGDLRTDWKKLLMVMWPHRLGYSMYVCNVM